MQARLSATARHTRSPLRATLTLRHARQVLCRATALFGRADLLLRAARRRRAPHRLDLPPMYPSPRALHTCTHVTLRRPTASHASQESTRMLRDVHMRECAHVPLPRALRPRAIISTRACMWCYRCRHCRPQFPTALDQNARFGQDRDQELRAGPRKSEPSPSPARRARAQPSTCQLCACRQQHAVQRHQCTAVYSCNAQLAIAKGTAHGMARCGSDHSARKQSELQGRRCERMPLRLACRSIIVAQRAHLAAREMP